MFGIWYYFGNMLKAFFLDTLAGPDYLFARVHILYIREVMPM